MPRTRPVYCIVARKRKALLLACHFPCVMWKARVLLSVIGQLIAVPAALFLMPTSCPTMFCPTTTTTVDTPAGDEDIAASTTATGVLDPASDGSSLEDR